MIITDYIVAYYTADVLNAQDYYSFGMLMPDRKQNENTFRYGFNNEEKDDELKGSGNSYAYGFRMYDPRLGKFLSVDPMSKKYPWYTPYQFAGNCPIRFIDLDGAEPKDPPNMWKPFSKPDHYGDGSKLFRVTDSKTQKKYWVTQWGNANAGYTFRWYNEDAKKWQSFAATGYTYKEDLYASNDVLHYDWSVMQNYGQGFEALHTFATHAIITGTLIGLTGGAGTLIEGSLLSIAVM